MEQMRQKFPGAARMQEMRWRMKSQVWDDSLGKWVKFSYAITDYTEARIAYEKARSQND